MSTSTVHTDLRRIVHFEQSDEYRAVIHSLIPGGAHTYSKGDDQFPLRGPAAISHGRGTKLWDIDGNMYLDCTMGLNSISLGHAYEPVIERVEQELRRGVNFQRPSYIEREMAETFLSLVPCHQMIKFAKNGSTVTTAAVKIARAYTGRALVAFPYDHPFYSYDDWFIGKTACNLGVPEEIQNLSVTYKADDLASLTALFEQYPGQIACVISEPEKNFGITADYLRQAIELAHRHGALYIFDEMITGYRVAFPGALTKYGVEPDMATWGKGIANGFSFSALTGKRDIMDVGGIRREGEQKLFLVSTTHGAETHSIAAGLATIDTYRSHDVIGHNHHIGRLVIEAARRVVEAHGLADAIGIVPCEWMPLFQLKNRDGDICNGMRTLLMQELIARGVLFQGTFVPCFSHTREDVDYFAAALDDALPVYARALEDGFEQHLVGPAAKPVFRRIV